MNGLNKLECLSLASLSGLLQSNALAYLAHAKVSDPFKVNFDAFSPTYEMLHTLKP
jgi:hypothetical protein